MTQITCKIPFKPQITTIHLAQDSNGDAFQYRLMSEFIRYDLEGITFNKPLLLTSNVGKRAQ